MNLFEDFLCSMKLRIKTHTFLLLFPSNVNVMLSNETEYNGEIFKKAEMSTSSITRWKRK
jgi:hypothetical protein